MNDPMIELFIAADLFLKGERVGGFEKRRAHSWVKNYYNRLAALLCGSLIAVSQDTDFRRTSGAVSESNTGSPNTSKLPFYRTTTGDMTIQGTSGNDSRGIVVGSGEGAEDFGMGNDPAAESYKLTTLIANGNSAGELGYAVQNALRPTITPGANVIYAAPWERYFNNTSGGDVTVNEVGIYADGNFGFNMQIMMARDLLPSSLVIADSGQLKVTYTITVTIPGQFTE